MPDPPPGKRRPASVPPVITPVPDRAPAPAGSHSTAGSRSTSSSTAPRYAELHCRTNFSFLEGASHPDELVQQAAALRLSALAITDRNSLAGVVRAHVAAKQTGLKLIIGAEITPQNAPPLLLWAMNRTGYGRLCRLITRGRRQAPKGECHLVLADVLEHADGLLAGVPLVSVEPAQTAALALLREAFRDRLYALAELHRGPDDLARLQRMTQMAHVLKLPLVAANDVHYHVPERQALQDVLTAIRHGCPVAELGARRFPNAERHLKSADRITALFRGRPDLVARTQEVADRCSFSLDELRYDYPEELCPAGLTPMRHLTELTWQGARDRYPRGIPLKVRQLLEHELRLIGELNYPAYFLTVWDLVRFARSRGILCQGRGSAANSAVCYCLGITSVDPDRIDVLFERFLSKERNEAPDIDVDFEHERREEVIQYLYQKYGRERAGMTGAVISYRPRSAIRDVGKALGLSLDRVDQLVRHVDHLHDRTKLESRFREAGLPPESRLGQQLIALILDLLDFPRHLSQHSGGMVLTNGPLCELVPIENASMPGRTVVEWDKDDLDALGILKVDVLALGMLTAIRKAFDLVRQHHHRRLTLATIPAHDRRVFDMIGRADTMGVFQIESRAQMAMLPRLQPRCFYDLVIEVAIVRPGPIQGDMVHPYLRRRCGEEPVEYPDERIRAILDKTLGVPIFQEQAMRLAIVAAGFTPGEADQLRRAMGAWRKRGIIDQFQRKLVDGMTASGYSAEFAQRVFQQLQGFGEYGFPESHSCSFALLVWASAWLKYHYPAAFTAALLNSQPMGFYAPAQLVADARKHGVTVRPVDVQFSEQDCTLEPEALPEAIEPDTPPQAEGSGTVRTARAARRAFVPALRLGLRLLHGLSSAEAAAITTARQAGRFASVDDFAQRTGLPKATLTRLARAGAFLSLQDHRREALWDGLADRASAPLLESALSPDHEPSPGLTRMPAVVEVIADYQHTGLSLRQHPVSFLRPRLNALQVVPASHLMVLRPGQVVTVAGLVLMRQRPGTASGITFVTLEDETGIINLIVYPATWEHFHAAARTASVMLVTGTLQRDGQIIHVLAGRIRNLSDEGLDLPTTSRDFR